MWIEPDGSGRARLQITAPTALLSQFGGSNQLIAEAKEKLANSDNTRLRKLTAVSTGLNTTLAGEIQFKDARQLGSLLKNFRDPLDSQEKSEPEILFGETEVAMNFPNLNYTRQLDLRPLLPEQANNALSLKMLGDSQFQYRVHFPTQVTTHNADTLSPDGKTLTWEMPLRELFQSPQTMSFTAPIPRLSLYTTLTAVLLFALILVAFILWSRRQSKA